MPARRWEAGTNYRGRTVLCTVLSFSAASLSAVGINPFRPSPDRPAVSDSLSYIEYWISSGLSLLVARTHSRRPWIMPERDELCWLWHCSVGSDISHLLVRTDNLLAKLCKWHSQTKNSTESIVPWQSWLYLCHFYYTEAIFDFKHTHGSLEWARLVMFPLRKQFLRAMVRSVAQIIFDCDAA